MGKKIDKGDAIAFAICFAIVLIGLFVVNGIEVL